MVRDDAAFAPDLILELGRGAGNSTAVFCQAVHRLGAGRIVSFELEAGWPARERIAPSVPAGWFAPLEALGTDILTVDFDALVRGHERILVLWDAHGFGVAEAVLGRLLPALADRAHLVLIHDISDNRYSATTRDYSRPDLARRDLAGGDWELE